MSRRPLVIVIAAGFLAVAGVTALVMRQRSPDRCVRTVHVWERGCLGASNAEALLGLDLSGFDLERMGKALGKSPEEIRMLLLRPCAFAGMGRSGESPLSEAAVNHVSCAGRDLVCATYTAQEAAPEYRITETAFQCDSGLIVRSSLTDGLGQDGVGLTDGKCARCEWP